MTAITVIFRITQIQFWVTSCFCPVAVACQNNRLYAHCYYILITCKLSNENNQSVFSSTQIFCCWWIVRIRLNYKGNYSRKCKLTCKPTNVCLWVFSLAATYIQRMIYWKALATSELYIILEGFRMLNARHPWILYERIFFTLVCVSLFNCVYRK